MMSLEFAISNLLFLAMLSRMLNMMATRSSKAFYWFEGTFSKFSRTWAISWMSCSLHILPLKLELLIISKEVKA